MAIATPVRAAHVLAALAAGLGILMSHPASAFPPFGVPPPPPVVVEFHNTSLDHYFYTAFFEEAQAIDAGAAGTGWRRTGLGFAAYPTLESSRAILGAATCAQDAFPCMPVSRFYSRAANSHFFTGFAAEADGLKQPGTGWGPEGIGFHAPLPQAGHCPSGVPVVRFFNNSATSNNHRFTANTAAMQQMRDRGWTEEGIAFCAYAPFEDTVSMRVSVFGAAQVGSVAQCNAEVLSQTSCLAVGNVDLPMTPYAPSASATDDRDEFNARTGIALSGRKVRENLGSAQMSRAAAASNVFIQFTDGGDTLGLHLTTGFRGPSPYSTLTPLTRLPTQAPAAGVPDLRLFPWRERHNTDYELVFDSGIALRSVFAVAGSQAYGNAVIEFVDTRSGGHLRFNVIAFGTFQSNGFIGRDAKDGVVIVGAGSPRSTYSRSDSPFFPVVASRTDYFDFFPHGFSFRINRGEFGTIVAAARTVDPSLSGDPTDYLVGHFGLHNEIAGNGEIGVTVQKVSLQLAPVP